MEGCGSPDRQRSPGHTVRTGGFAVTHRPAGSARAPRRSPRTGPPAPRTPPRDFKKMWCRWTPGGVWGPASVTHYIGQGALSHEGRFFGGGQRVPRESKKVWCRRTRAGLWGAASVQHYRGDPRHGVGTEGAAPVPGGGPRAGRRPARGARARPSGRSCRSATLSPRTKPCMPAHPGRGGRLRTTVAPPAAVPASRTPLATRRQDVRARAGARGRAA